MLQALLEADAILRDAERSGSLVKIVHPLHVKQTLMSVNASMHHDVDAEVLDGVTETQGRHS